MLDRLGGRENVIRFLTATVVVGIGVWIVTEAVFFLFLFLFGLGRTIVPSFTNWLAWAEVLSRVAHDVWLGALTFCCFSGCRRV